MGFCVKRLVDGEEAFEETAVCAVMEEVALDVPSAFAFVFERGAATAIGECGKFSIARREGIREFHACRLGRAHGW